MIYNDIKNFNKQFGYEPRIENAEKLGKFKKFVVAGMGGSHLAADILKTWKPDLDLVIWNNYGLPPLKDLKERLIIASSYSGNTEEAIDVFEEAKKRKLNVAAVGAGGKLITLAHIIKVPHVVIPSAHIQPRMALGYSFKAILALMGEKKALVEASKLSFDLHPSRFELAGRKLAKKLKGSVPVIYSSQRNYAVVYNWKVKLNETGKIPAFWNVLPELNHNEMTGFSAGGGKARTKSLSSKFRFIFLKDSEDEPRIVKRMRILEKLLADRGFRIETALLRGKTRLIKIFSSLVLADWTAYYTAKQYGVEPEEVPIVEEFKKLIA